MRVFKDNNKVHDVRIFVTFKEKFVWKKEHYLNRKALGNDFEIRSKLSDGGAY